MDSVVIGQAMFMLGTVFVVLSPATVAFALVVLLPRAFRHEDRPERFQRTVWFAMGSFAVGAGLVVVSPFEPVLVGVGVATIAFGLAIWFVVLGRGPMR